MSKKGNPLGVKQLCGPSKLPTLQRRQEERQAAANRRTTSRQLKLDSNRGLDVVPVVNKEEKKQDLLRSLAEYKARKAEQRLEQLRNRPKPFVVGKLAATPARNLNIPSTASKLATPNSVPISATGSQRAHGKSDRKGPFVSGRSSTASKQATPKRAPLSAADQRSQFNGPKRMASSANSKIPLPGSQRPRFNAVVPKQTGGEHSGASAVPLPTEPKRKEEGQAVRDDAVSLNGTYEILPGQLAGEISNGPTGGENQRNGPIEEVLNGTVTLEAGSNLPSVEPKFTTVVSEGEQELLVNLDIKAPWHPGASSSPSDQDQGCMVGKVNAPLTFGMENDDASPNASFTSAAKDFTDRCKAPISADGIKAPESLPEELQNGAAANDERYTGRDGNETVVIKATEQFIPIESDTMQTSVAVRRSTRSTRYTGTFKNETTPRNRTSVDQIKNSKLSVQVDSRRLDEILSEPGIMEELTPDFLLSNSSPASSIMDELASLDLTATDVGSPRGSMATWTSLQITSDEDGTVSFVPPSDYQLSGASASQLGTTYDASALSTTPSPAPVVVFDATPEAPGSILRTTVHESIQKKSVRFPHKLGSPILFERGDPPCNTTPPSEIVKSYTRRQSTMPKNGGDMMRFSDDDDDTDDAQ